MGLKTNTHTELLLAYLQQQHHVVIIVVIIIITVVVCLVCCEVGTFIIHFIEEDMEAQRDLVACSRSHICKLPSWHNPKMIASKPTLVLLYHAASGVRTVLKGPCQFAFHSLLPGTLPQLSPTAQELCPCFPEQPHWYSRLGCDNSESLQCSSIHPATAPEKHVVLTDNYKHKVGNFSFSDTKK